MTEAVSQAQTIQQVEPTKIIKFQNVQSDHFPELVTNAGMT